MDLNHPGNFGCPPFTSGRGAPQYIVTRQRVDMQSGNSSSLKGLKLSRSPATLRLVDPIPCSQRGAASSWRGFTYISHIEHICIIATCNDYTQHRAWHEQVTSCAASSPRFARDLVKVRANVLRGSRKCQGWFAQRLRKVCKSEVRASGWRGSRNELWRFAQRAGKVRASGIAGLS